MESKVILMWRAVIKCTDIKTYRAMRLVDVVTLGNVSSISLTN